MTAQLHNAGKGSALPQRFEQRLGFLRADGIRRQFQEFIGQISIRKRRIWIALARVLMAVQHAPITQLDFHLR